MQPCDVYSLQPSYTLRPQKIFEYHGKASEADYVNYVSLVAQLNNLLDVT
jgi:hypothetical protein